MSEQLHLFEPRPHTHLKLASATGAGPRQPRNSGFGGTTRHSDRAGHGKKISDAVATVIEEHRRRTQILGIDPDLILVIETNRPLAPELVERAGLAVLEMRSDRVMVAFSSDPELTAFEARNAEYQKGSPGQSDKGNERAAKHEALFDCIEAIRQIVPSDLMGTELRSRISGHPSSDEQVRVEVHCWCSEDAAETEKRHLEVVAAIIAAGGEVLHRSMRIQAGWSVICCDIPLNSVGDLVATSRVNWINLLPRPLLDYPEVFGATLESLPNVNPPPANAPVVAIIDSGIRSSHPLLAPAVVGVEHVGLGIADGGDVSGHGTLVASLALYGPLEEAIAQQTQLTAAARLLSIRVLDDQNRFPEDRVWAETLIEAMELAIEAGARIINLSIGDDRRPYLPGRPTPVAAIIDKFIRDHPQVVVIACTGNFPLANHDPARLLSNDYPADMVANEESGLLDPGTAALAMTVGAICSNTIQGATVRQSAERLPVGGPLRPSPHTRLGPGPMYSVKPELVASGGSVLIDTLTSRPSNDKSVQVVGAGGSDPERLLATDAGTSYAAPLVTHAAARVLLRYPTLTGNGVRALLLCGAEAPPDVFADLDSQRRADQRRLTGYGIVSAARSETSTDHRVVMLSENSLELDQVHFYAVPIPSSFFDSGGTSTISVALAYDPPVRVTRIDYLANRMSFQVFHGLSLEDVRSNYVKAEADQELGDDVTELPKQLEKFRLDLQPSDTSRSRGTHHRATFTRQTKMSEAKSRELIIAVRSMNRWDTSGSEQDYALAVSLERDLDHLPLYAELRAELEPLLEIDIELEI